MYLLRKIITRHRYASTVAALLLVIILAFAYVSFDLYTTAKKAQQASENKANSLSAQIAATNKVIRLFAFNSFLENWRQNLNQKATIPLVYLSQGTKEQKAAMFLFNPNPVADKEDSLRRAVADEYHWFVEFVIGENHLRNGDRSKALEAFKRSHETIPRVLLGTDVRVDSWLVGQVQSRIKQLSTSDKPKVEIKESQ